MPTLRIDSIVQGLRQARSEWRASQTRPREPGAREFPSADAVAEAIDAVRKALFPMRLGPTELRQENEDYYVGHTLSAALNTLAVQARLELGNAGVPADEVEARALEAIRAFSDCLPDIRRLLDTDVLAAYEGDPAARSVDEVLLCYPGVLAMIHHRLAHRLYGLGLPLLARIAAERAHSLTGIDIHPGARIGARFFIDHGTGVVIGETAVIGERVRIYQAVTLGARRFPLSQDGTLQKGLQRHPTVEDDVVIYAGATVLGNVRLGKGASIGGNVWLTHDVPAGGSVTQASSVS